MRNQVLLVVGLIGVILGSAANAADIYDVWAGNTDYRLAPESWDIFYSIDQYDYVKLGGASGSALFSGSYRFYVVAARSTLFVDSVQEPVSGAYIGSAHTTGNLTGLSNISGPPDGQYTFFNGAMNSGGTYGAFVVMECSAYPNWAGIRVITGTYGSPIFSSGTSDFSDVPFMHVRPGDTRTYVGRGAYAGARYTQTFTEETFLNVTCLKVQESAVAWAGKEGIVVHLAKDTTGGCWLFRLEVEGAIVFAAPTQTEAIPFAVVPEMNMRLAASAWSVGTAIFGFDAATEEVVSDSATLPEFPGWQLVKTKWTSNDGLDVDWTYYHHSLGKVLDVWDDAGNTSGDGWMLEDSGATEWTLIIQAPQGVGTTSPGPGAYTYGVGMASVPITATPALGWRFDHWTGASTSSSATLCVESGTASEIKVLKPVFVQQGTWTLTIEAAEGNGYTTPPAGTYTYYIGQSSPPITATAAQGWGFDQWQCPQSDSFEGSYRSVSNPIVISGEGSTKTLKAVFMPGLIRTFHDTEPVLSVAFSPDGARMLTGTAHEYYMSGNAKLWDLTSGNSIRNFLFTGGGAGISAVAFSPDGMTVATGGDEARLWDVATGVCTRTFLGSPRTIASMAFSPDGTRILTGKKASMGSGCAELWDLQSAICIRTFADDANICSVAFSPDGAEVLTGEEGTYTGSGYSYSARLWNASTGDCIRTFRDVESIKSVAFSPDGTRILTGADTASRGSVRLWDAATGECLRTYTDAPTRCVAFSPDGTHVLTVEGDYFGVAKLWDAATGYCVRTFASSSSEYLETAAFSPDGTQVLTGGGASSGQTIGVARLWWSGLRPSDTWTLTIQSPQGSGSTTPTSGSYTYGVGQSSASVLAAPTAGWRFSHWEGTAFSGSPSANPIAVPSGTPAQTKTLRAVFVEASAILHVASSTAAPASEAQAPVILSVQQGEAITTLQFNCSIAPAAGSPPAVSSVSFSPSAGIPAPNIVDGTTLPGSVLVAWFSHMSPAQTGAVTLGTIRFNVPGGCELDDSYTATISSLSGTNGGTPVPIAAGPAGTITIAGTWYQVGDVYPPNGPDGGQFGDGKLENADVVKLFYRSMGADPAAPPQASDAWNAGDIYPKDSPPQAGGDGVLSNADVVELFYRSILSQTSYDRVRSGVGRISRVHQTGPALQEAPSSDAENLLLVQPAAYCLPGTTCSLRLLLSLQPGEQLTTLQFNCTIEPVGGAAAVGTVSYAQAAGIPAPNMNDGATVPGSVLVAWFMHMPVPVQNGANLGTIAFTVPAGSQLGDKWLVKIINTSGTDSGLPVAIGPGPDLNLPVSLTGDTTGDCRVNILDLIFIRGRMNLDVATSDNWKADVTGDGRINILDLISVRGKIGASCP